MWDVGTRVRTRTRVWIELKYGHGSFVTRDFQPVNGRHGPSPGTRRRGTSVFLERAGFAETRTAFVHAWCWQHVRINFRPSLNGLSSTPAIPIPIPIPIRSTIVV